MNRACEDCQLCCTLLPVRELSKGANERCKHQCDLGCNAYKDRPPSCRQWSCMWMLDPLTINLDRPDIAHYVIDPVPDAIAVPVDGEIIHIPAVQVWCDPKHRDAHRDPALRAYLLTLSAGVAIVRWSAKEGITLIPPSLSPTGDWWEIESQCTDKIPEATHGPNYRSAGSLSAYDPT